MRLAAFALTLVAAGCGRPPGGPDAGPLGREEIEKNLQTQADEVGRVVLAGDHERMADLSHPELVRQMGGRARYVKRLGEIAAEMKAGGVRFEKITAARPTALVEAPGKWFGVVPSDIDLVGPDGRRLAMKSHQIADSVDGGRTWRFVDANGIAGDRRKLKRVMPDFPDSIALPEQLPPQRGDG